MAKTQCEKTGHEWVQTRIALEGVPVVVVTTDWECSRRSCRATWQHDTRIRKPSRRLLGGGSKPKTPELNASRIDQELAPDRDTSQRMGWATVRSN